MANAAPVTCVDSARPLKPRFSWPMRLFLGILLFDIVFHSLACMVPYQEWLEDMGLEWLPKRLPTRQEMTDLRKKAEADESPVLDRVMESCDSVWDFFKPWPPARVRHKLDTWEDKGMYALSWLVSRLDFFELLAGVPQRWTMFSPNASKGTWVARSRLLFDDGSYQDIRLSGDPEDLTSYSHWFQEKILDYELRVANDYDSRLGYCNFLSCQHPRNSRGSPLVKIYIYKIGYDYPAPGQDALEVLRSQSGPPHWDRKGPDFVYEVATKDLWKLSEEKRERARALFR